MSKQPFQIKDPDTGRKLSVSRDVYYLIAKLQERAQKQQEILIKKSKKVKEVLAKKKYIAGNSIFVFDEHGKVDIVESQITVDQEMTLKNLLDQLNDAIDQKNTDTEKHLKQINNAVKSA